MGAALVEDSPQELTAFVTVFPRGARLHSPRTQVIWAGADTKAAAAARCSRSWDLAPILHQAGRAGPPTQRSCGQVHEEALRAGTHAQFRSALLEHLDARSATTIGRLPR